MRVLLSLLVLLITVTLSFSATNPKLTFLSYYEDSASGIIVKEDKNGNLYVITSNSLGLTIRAFDKEKNLLWEKNITPNQQTLKNILKAKGADYGGRIDINQFGFGSREVVYDNFIDKTNKKCPTESYTSEVQTSCGEVDNFGNFQLDDAIYPHDAKISGDYLYILRRTCDPNFNVVNGESHHYVYRYTHYRTIVKEMCKVKNIEVNEYEKIFEFNKEIILFKISLKDGSIAYSSYLGAYSDDEARALDIDKNGNIYITGYTRYVSPYDNDPYPPPVGAEYYEYSVPKFSNSVLTYSSPKLDSAPNSSSCQHKEYINPFVLKLTPNNNTYSFSKIHIFGSYCIDRAFDIAVDKNSNVYVAGETYAGGDNDYTHFDINNISPSRNISNPSNSGSDVFVVQFDKNLFAKSASMFGSGANDDVFGGIDTDDNGNVYLIGNASDRDMPLFQNKFSMPVSGSCYVIKFDSSLQKKFVTYIDPQVGVERQTGGRCNDMIVSPDSKIHIVGVVDAVYQNPKAFLYTMDGSNQNTIHIEKVSGADEAINVDLDDIGNPIFAGNTQSTFTPINPLTGYSGTSFIAKLSFKEKLEVSIDKQFKGKGKIVSNPSGIDCPNKSCSAAYNIDSKITLTATPDTGSVFVEWHPDSDCASCKSNKQCQITLDSSKHCVAVFDVDNNGGGGNKPPNKPTITADKTEGQPPLTVNFTCKATDPDGQVVNYELTISPQGGGQSSNQTSKNGSFSYTFSSEGVYEVVCEAIDNEGERASSDPIEITVSLVPSIKSFTANPTNGTVPLKVTFSWDVSNVPSPFLNSCQLDVDGDGQADYTNLPCSGKSATKTHTYNSVGKYTAKLILTDGKNKIEKSITITVSQGKVKLTLNVTAGGGNVVDKNLDIECGDKNKCTKEFNPGDKVSLLAIASNGHIFDTWGEDCSACGKNILCEFNIIKDLTCKATFVFNNNTNKAPKINSFTVDKSEGEAPLKVNFTCKAYDLDGNIKGYVYDVDGDGKHDIITDKGSVSYTYSKEGTYKASCGAIDDKGTYVISNKITIKVKKASSSGGGDSKNGGGSSGGCSMGSSGAGMFILLLIPLLFILRRFNSKIAISLMLIFFTTVSYAKEYYVSPDGTGELCTKKNPCNFIKALDNASGLANADNPDGSKPDNNPKIIMLPGEYNLSDFILYELPNLTITAEPKTVIIKGNGAFRIISEKGSITVENVIFYKPNISLESMKLTIKNVYFHSCSVLDFNNELDSEVFIFEGNTLNKCNLTVPFDVRSQGIFFTKNTFKNSVFSIFIGFDNPKRVEFIGNKFMNLKPMPHPTHEYWKILDIGGDNISEIKVIDNIFYKLTHAYKPSSKCNKEICPLLQLYQTDKSKTGKTIHFLNNTFYGSQIYNLVYIKLSEKTQNSLYFHNNVFASNITYGCRNGKDLFVFAIQNYMLSSGNNLFSDCSTGEEWGKCVYMPDITKSSGDDKGGIKPGFVNPDRGILFPAKGSPLIDKGAELTGGDTVLPITNKDVYGNDRVIDGDGDGQKKIDIGAVEFSDGAGLEVALDGDGEGDVVSSDSKIRCGSNCFGKYPVNTSVTLEARPFPDAKFVKWGTDCSNCGTNKKCTITLNSTSVTTACVAIFSKLNYTLNVKDSSTGNKGMITDSEGKIKCGTIFGNYQKCEDSYDRNKTVVLFATPPSGDDYAIIWKADCSNCKENSYQCSIVMNSDKTCDVEFVLQKSSSGGGCSFGYGNGLFLWLLSLITILSTRRYKRKC